MITNGPPGPGPGPDDVTAVGQESLRCHRCGVQAELAQRWRWSVGTDERGIITTLCADCARTSSRGIEAKLDDDWW